MAWLPAAVSLGTVLGLGLVLWWFWWRHEAAEARSPEPVDAEEQRPTSRTSVQASAQILFAEWRGRDVQVDCVIVGAARGARTGSLLGFTVAVPGSLPLGDSIVDIVRAWARDGEVVDVELTRVTRGWRACFDDGDSTINLELSRLLAAEAGLGGSDDE